LWLPLLVPRYRTADPRHEPPAGLTFFRVTPRDFHALPLLCFSPPKITRTAPLNPFLPPSPEAFFFYPGPANFQGGSNSSSEPDPFFVCGLTDFFKGRFNGTLYDPTLFHISPQKLEHTEVFNQRSSPFIFFLLWTRHESGQLFNPQPECFRRRAPPGDFLTSDAADP